MGRAFWSGDLTSRSREQRRLRVLLASPLPPPPGGIAAWTQRMLAHPVPSDIDLSHVDVGTHLLHHYAARVGRARFVAQGQVTARFLARLLALRPDVVHLTTSYDTAFLRDGLFVAASRAVGSAMVLNIRGGDFERFVGEQSESNRRRIFRVLRACTAVVPVTGATARYLRNQGLERVCVIPNCVDTTGDPAQPRGGKRWLFVGWIMPAKGIRELLQALASFPDATVTLAGPLVTQDGIEGGTLLASECTRLGITSRVVRLPEASHEQIRKLYREHDIFVFPSHREGFPNVVLEAMEAGLPVVASDVGAVKEIIRDTRDGFVVPAKDVPALVAALRRYQDDPMLASRHGAAGRERVFERFTVERIAAQWYSLYERVIRNPVRWQRNLEQGPVPLVSPAEEP